MQNNKRNIAIKVNSLSKIYPLYNSPKDRMKEALHPKRKKYHKDFYALRDVSFEVERGDSLGIIGQNGSGKSTLLKILSRVLTPSSGTFDVRGRVVSLLELGSGFNPDLTGIENIYFYGTILGFSKKKVDAKLDDIVAYADIGQFINQPLKTYSSGMRARLGFAVASHVDPDILILDEVLAVGDLRFKQKCLRTMRDIIDQKRTVVFVSHSMGAVTSFCNKTMWLNEGTVKDFGESNDVVKKYVGFMSYGLGTNAQENDTKHTESNVKDKSGKKDAEELQIKDIRWKDVSKLESFGEYGGIIEKAALYLKDSKKKVDTLTGGEWVSLYVKVKIKEQLDRPGLGIRVLDRLGNAVFTVNNYLYNKSFGVFKPNEQIIIRTDFKFPLLKSGKYLSTVSLSDGTQEEHIQHHWIHDVLIIEVQNPDPKFKRNLLVLDNEDYIVRVVKGV